MMDRSAVLTLMVHRAALLALVMAALLVAVAPSGLHARAWPMPDLAYAAVAAWAIRRPEAVGPGLIVLISLTADLLRGAPLGVGTLALVAVGEVLRPAGDGLLRGPFLTEWAVVMALFVGTLVFGCLALWLAVSPRPSFVLLAQHALGTAVAYPAVAFLARAVLPDRGRVRRGLL